MKKKLLAALLVIGLISASLCFVGCDGPKDINVEDLSLSTATETRYHEDITVLKITNNSDYPITELKVKYKQKSDVTSDQLALFKESHKYKNADEATLKKIYLTSHTKKICDPKKSVTDRIVISGTNDSITSQEMYDMMEPSTIEFSYIASDGKIYTTTYDYSTKEYNKSEDGKIAKKVPEGPLASKFPMPDAEVIETNSDDESYISTEAYGIDEAGFQKYIETAKKAGYEQKRKTDSTYEGKSSDGYELSVIWFDSDNYISIHFSKSK